MAHIHTQPGQHDHTASAFIFRTDFDQPKIILHLHKKLGAYMQFGGHIELHENPWQAIVHELREESGYDIDQLQILQPKVRLTNLSDNAIIHPQSVSHTTHPLGNDHFHTDSAYAMTTGKSPRHQPDEGESTDSILLNRDELVSLPADQIIENVREIALYIFDEILPHWQPVATDEINQKIEG
jgi:8-oxo-dGTP pyrophosphatase MutT (NUDIX family)